MIPANEVSLRLKIARLQSFTWKLYFVRLPIFNTMLSTSAADCTSIAIKSLRRHPRLLEQQIMRLCDPKVHTAPIYRYFRFVILPQRNHWHDSPNQLCLFYMFIKFVFLFHCQRHWTLMFWRVVTWYSIIKWVKGRDIIQSCDISIYFIIQ